MHAGDVGIEIAPLLDASHGDEVLAARVDALLRRTCRIARALTDAEQAALKLWVGEDPAKARKYFSLSERYESYREFRVEPRGVGLHGMAIPPGEVVRLTQEEVVNHPLWRNFGRSRPSIRRCAVGSHRASVGRTVGSTAFFSSATRAEDATSTEMTRSTSASSRALVGEAVDALRAASSIS